MELIEWSFTILSFVAFYFFISKKASLPGFRMIGLILSNIISLLMAIFSFSINILSIGFINVCYIFLNSYGIYNCYREIQGKQTGKEDNNEEINSLHIISTD